MIEFNVNHYVYVELTDEGRETHREWWAENTPELMRCEYPYRPPQEDADGWSKWQLWELMQIFGPRCGLGMPIQFLTTIRIEAEAP